MRFQWKVSSSISPKVLILLYFSNPMGDDSISLGEPLSKAFETFKENIVLMIVPLLIFGVGAWVAGMITALIITIPVSLIILGALAYGYFYIHLMLVRGKNAEIMDSLKGFKEGRWKRAGWLGFLIGILTALWSFLFVIPGIIAALRYSFAYFIMHDHPELTGNEARKLSCEMTKGHKGKIFVYVVVAYLGMFLFGIGVLVTGPLAFSALAHLYEHQKHHRTY